jgi:hypothetical protein
MVVSYDGQEVLRFDNADGGTRMGFPTKKELDAELMSRGLKRNPKTNEVTVR